MDFSILKRKLAIGKRIDDFLDHVSESGLLFKLGVDSYLKGNLESFEKKLEDITHTENQGDALRRTLEEQLYMQTLIALRTALPFHLKGFIKFGYKVGWRVSEIAGLTWKQVDLNQGIVRLEVGETKNDEARTVYLDDELKEIFTQ
jgi:integrase